MQAIEVVAQRIATFNVPVFGGAGGTLIVLYEALRKYGVEIIVARSEQGAGFMAQGAYKSSLQLQFCAATSGPGATNLLTPMADCFYDSSAVVFLTGQIATSQMVGSSRQPGFQFTPIVEMAKPITKFAHTVLNGKDLVSSFDTACKIAMEGRRGPCLIDLPTDCQKQSV